MTTLNIKNLQAGMEIREDVCNFNGNVLLKTGAVLTEKHIRALKAWGITEVNVKVAEKALNYPGDKEPYDTMDDTPDNTIDTRMVEDLRIKFKKNDLNNPVVAEIFRIVKMRKSGILNDDGHIEK